MLASVYLGKLTPTHHTTHTWIQFSVQCKSTVVYDGTVDVKGGGFFDTMCGFVQFLSVCLFFEGATFEYNFCMRSGIVVVYGVSIIQFIRTEEKRKVVIHCKRAMYLV